jgi:type VI secretion system protein ImpF
MAKAKLERTVLTSFLDRLIDENPRSGSEPAMSFDESVRRLKASVLRDLDWLLNTRRGVDSDEELTPEVRESVYNYGLPDISSLGVDAPETHRQIVQNVEETITLFEPRLSDVRARLAETPEGSIQELRIFIEATLEMDPHPERIAFDTTIDVSTGRFTVEDSDHA